MNTATDRVELPLERPFGISRGTRDTVEVSVVRVEAGGHTGWGTATASPRFGETPDGVAAALPGLLDAVAELDPDAPGAAEAALTGTAAPAAARAAVSVALHDLAARRRGVPLHRLWDLDPGAPVTSSFTVSLDDPGAMADRAAAAVDAGFGVLKGKLGGGDDVAAVEAVRAAAPDATLRVDANEAWSPREALDVIYGVRGLDVEFVEQPVSAGDPDGLRRVHDGSPLRIAADEAVATAGDVPAIADRADVVVVKVMQAGGLRAALDAIRAAHEHGLDVMIGCRVESAASISAACHLVPLAEYADLDGALLLAADPFEGVPMPGGRLEPAALGDNGTGATRLN